MKVTLPSPQSSSELTLPRSTALELSTTMADPQPKSSKTTLFIRNLSPKTTQSDLETHFGGIGPLRRTLVVTEPGKKTCRGIGFVTFAVAEDADNAKKVLDGSMILRRKITIDIAKQRHRADAKDTETAGLEREKKQKLNEKKRGAKQGAPAMRTVLIRSRKKEPVTAEEAQGAVGAEEEGSGFETVVVSGDSLLARCVFESWVKAGAAAARASDNGFDAVIEALSDGQRTRLIVRNLPFWVDPQEVKQRFVAIGPVRDFRLIGGEGLARKTRKGKKKRMGRGEKHEEGEEKKSGTENGTENDNETDKEQNKDKDMNGDADSCGKGKSEDEQDGDKSNLVLCGGYAFVEYFLVQNARMAVTKINGSKIGGRVVAVDIAVGKMTYQAKDAEGETGVAAKEHTGDPVVKDESPEDQSEEESDKEDEDADNRGKKQEMATDDEVEISPVKKPASSTDDEMGRTVFVRNLLFETSAPELWQAMEDEFGKVEQAVLVMHPITKRPRGTAFVRFSNPEDAKKAVQQAGEGDTTQSKSSALRAEASGFALQGRYLMISRAVNRNKARDLVIASKGEKDLDPRNLRLAWIGQVKRNSKEARGLTDAELERREKAEREKKNKLERNPNAFVSDVRLCVRNLPRDFDEKVVKHMFLLAGRETKGKQAAGKDPKAPMVSGERKDGKDKKHAAVAKSDPKVTHCTVVRDEERKDRSKGYAFVQFSEHEHAMRALEYLNNNSKVIEWLIKKKPKALGIDEHRERTLKKQWGNVRRLMVDFSLEDRRVVQVLERVKEKGRKISEEHKKRRFEEGGERKVRKRQKKKGKRFANSEAESVSKEEEADSLKTTKMSRSEKKAALKRQRAAGSTEARKISASRESEEKKGKSSNSAETKKRANRDEDESERPDAKPKKPKKKRKKNEVEKDVTFDRLVNAYKQKLARIGEGPSEGVSSVSAPKNESRWFE